jgi:KaiC/GvpD/RAD55 family RecA-like ATPase
MPLVLDEADDDGPILTRLADVQPEAVQWLWPGRVALGKVTTLIGDPGVGKSMLTMSIAASFSRQGYGVVILSAEDAPADTIRPRVEAHRGDVSRIAILEAVRSQGQERSFSLERDLPALEIAIQRAQATVVIVDPISAYLPKTDTYKDAEVRSVLAPLARLAQRMGMAVIAVMHLTKDAQRAAIYRAPGSIAFVAAARVVLALAKDPDDEERRLLVGVKNNLGPIPPALAFRISGEGRVQWEQEPVGDVDVDALLSQGPRRGEDRPGRREAEDFLRETLQRGAMPAKAIEEAARANGISWSRVSGAKRRLGVESQRRGGVAGKGTWYWLLPKEPA